GQPAQQGEQEHQRDERRPGAAAGQLLLGEVVVLVGDLRLLAGEGRGLRGGAGGARGGVAVAGRGADDLRGGGGGLLAAGQRLEVHHVGDDAGDVVRAAA